MDSESRDQYPPRNLMGWETGFARRLQARCRLGGCARGVEISRLITLDQLHWSGTLHISRYVICEQAKSRKIRWRRPTPCCRIVLCGRGLDCLYRDDLLAFRSESDHPFTSILVSACRLLEAITGGYWTVVNFQYVRSVQQLNLQDVLSGNAVSGILRQIGLVSEFQR
jgi:hypothetical protein